MKKLFRFFLAVIILLALAAGALIWYVQPEEQLDLAHSEVSIENKLLDMANHGKMETSLSEPEVNNLLKQSLAANPRVDSSLMITGARFRVDGNQLAADVNVKYRERVNIGATLFYSLEWKDPAILVKFKRVQVKSLHIPPTWFKADSFTIPVTDQLPDVVKIRNVRFQGNEIIFRFQLKKLF